MPTAVFAYSDSSFEVWYTTKLYSCSVDVKGYVTDDLCVDVSGSVHGVGRVVNGRKVMAVI